MPFDGEYLCARYEVVKCLEGKILDFRGSKRIWWSIVTKAQSLDLTVQELAGASDVEGGAMEEKQVSKVRS